MDRHAYRRLSLAGAAAGLVTTGLLHPGNAWLQGPVQLTGFLVAFAVVTIGATFLLAEGLAWLRPALRFVRTSAAFAVGATILVLNLVALAALSWHNMAMMEQGAVVAFGVLGAASGVREVAFGVRSTAAQAYRDARFRGATA